MSKKDTHRVQFMADTALVSQADAVAEIMNMSRTDLIKRALHTYLTEKREDDQFRRQAQEAFIDDRIDETTFREALGTEELVKAKQLQAAFATLGDGVPTPDEVPEIPSDTEFYGTPEEGTVIDIDKDSQLVVKPADSTEEKDTASGEQT